MESSYPRSVDPMASQRRIDRTIMDLIVASLLTGALLMMAPAGGHAAAQPVESGDRTCVDVQGVDGVMLWYVCAGHYLADTPKQTSTATGSANISHMSCLEARSFDAWAYWPGHPGFLIPLSIDLTRWIATPVHPGLLCT